MLEVFAKSTSELKYNLMFWKETLKRRNVEETKTRGIVEGIESEQVRSLKYLGAQVQNDGKQEAEINERIGTAMKMYYAPNRNFLRMRAIGEKTKDKAFFPNLHVRWWELTKDIRSRIQTAEMNKNDYEKRQSEKRRGETRTGS